MGDQYPSLPQGPGALQVQDNDHTTRPAASSEAPGLWGQCLPEWKYYVANIYSQVRLELRTRRGISNG
jgi:hypothetical protein